MNSSKDIDLKLIRTFISVYEAGSAQKAAVIMGVTPPYVYRQLNQLRDITGDPLYQQNMVPTLKAVNLYHVWSRILSEVESSIEEEQEYDNEIARDRFLFGTSEYVELITLANVYSHLEAHAPNASLTSLRMGSDTRVNNRQNEFDAGVDFIISESFEDKLGLESIKFFEDEWVFVANSSMNMAREIGLSEFKELNVIEPGTSPLSVMKWARQQEGQISRCHSLMSIPYMVNRSDNSIGLLPRKIANTYSDAFGLSVVKANFELPPIEAYIYFPSWVSHSSKHQWFISIIQSVC